MYRLLIITLSLVLLSCARQAPVPESKTTLPATPTLGVTQLLDGTETWKEYNCESKKLPFIIIEQNEILPTNVQAGKEIQHRFVYAACTSSDRQALKGSLNRKIYYKGRAVFQDATRNFEIKPGKWKVNAVVAIPVQAKPGNYNFELTISSPTTTVKKNLSFLVQK
ncbi:MAG: hypothetical protein U1F76_00450 [Candidatus Competibacteraceae bacterium]